MSQPNSTQVVDPGTTPALRLTSLDVFRGFVMFLMLAEVLKLSKLAAHFPEATWLEWVTFHTTHVHWVGCSLHDLIQPGFSFLVGAALPFSLAKRQQSGQATWWLYVHAAWRSLLLIALGIFVRSLNSDATNFTFEDTLTQIGLGYFLLFAIARGPHWLAPTAIGVILLGYWMAFAANPPAEDFDYQAVGVPVNWTEHQTGLASAWNKNSNLAWKFDTWFLNLFPRPEPFSFHSGGYSTLSFVPTLATMLMGLLAGRWLLHEQRTSRRLLLLTSAVVVGLLSGWLLNEFGICPVVKRIWTPSFALWSGGWCFLFVLIFHVVCDVWQLKSWSFPLVVIGCNCIFVYLLNWTIKGSIIAALHRHFGTLFLSNASPEFQELFTGLGVLTIFWLLLFWMYRNKVFVKL
ncbi:MAG: DUF5009 domain-containing protein [Planctomycetaceae bacterium]|nr:DUF5009 domain-containing protein [Planctomycetaceae bacterium]